MSLKIDLNKTTLYIFMLFLFSGTFLAFKDGYDPKTKRLRPDQRTSRVNPVFADSDGDGIDDSIDLDDDNDGIPDAIECGEVYCGENVTNGSLEIPVIPAGTFSIVNATSVPGWNTTASDNMIEIWSTGFNGVPSAEGNQFAELNATQVSALYQELCITGGSRVRWEVKHRGRGGVDVAVVKIGASLATAVIVETMTSDNTAWSSYSGTYDVPMGQDNTFFIFEAVGGGSSGNFIDDIVITVLEEPVCTTDFDGDGIPNSFDLDSDNDGIFDIVEAGNGHLDLDNDGRIDGPIANVGNNGLFDDVETVSDSGFLNYNVIDTDNDGNLDIHELDSDNDSCNDVIEAGYTDQDNNGVLGTNPITVDVFGLITSGINGYTPPLDGNVNTILDFQEIGNNLSILNQPADQADCKGNVVIFEVLSSNSSTTAYQWEVNTGSGWTSVTDDANYSGSQLNQLQIIGTPAVFNNYQYRVVLSNVSFICQPNLVSDKVTLTVYETPQPSGNATQSFCDIDNATIADLQVTGTNITWYDASTGGSTMDPATALTHNTIYYATQTVDGCESTPRLAVTANVFETIAPPATIPPMRLCDDDSDSDDTNGLLEFNLRNNEITIANGATVSDFNFRYFRDALRDDEILTPGAYVNELAFGSPQVIYVTAENQLFTNCSTDVEFEIEVYELPVITSSVSLTQCDTDTDGQTPFNLTEANELISTDHSNETFTYYTNPTDALAGGSTGRITDTTLPVNPDTQYINPIANGSFVYARVENINGCSRVAEVELLVGASNIPPTFHLSYEICDTKEIDNDDTNGVATFNFSQAEADIEALFSQNVTVTFYTNLADALAEDNQINPSSHRNDLSPDSQNIYVRVDSNVVNACEGLGHFITLTVNPLPLTNTVANYPLCSDNAMANFQLATKDVEVIAGQTTPVLVTYHETLAEAQDPVGFPSGLDKNSYMSDTRTIFVRAAFDDNSDGIHDPLEECFNTDMQFDLVVNQNPIVTAPLEPIRRCSEQTDTFFNLREKEAEMSLGDTSIAFDYYETQTDLNNNTPISDYTNYLNTTLNNTIYVLATGTNACKSETTLELETTLYANLDLDPLPIEECEVDNDGYDFFDITRREDDILNGLDRNDFEFHYYISEEDANEVSLNPNFISDRFNFENTTRRTQTIYVRVTPVANACFSVIPIQLIVNPVPEIAIEPEYVICLSPTDISIPAALTTTLPNPPIDTNLDPADYTFQWFDSNNVAIPGETGSTFVPVQTGTYTVIATNILTGCTIPATTEVFGSYPPESITVALLTDAFSKNNIIEVTVEGNGSYEFRLDTGDWQDSPVFESVNGGEHTVYVRDLSSCNSISEVINVIDFPKFFTPNDDGYNDNWNIEALRSQPNSVIYIYDRYGKLLKQIRPFGNGWDGTFNGSLMPSSDYWFVVAYTEPRTGTSKMFRAHFTLKR